MSSLLSCLSEYSNNGPSSRHTLDLSSLELSELSSADFALLHQFLRNGATFEVVADTNSAHHNNSSTSPGVDGDNSHSSVLSSVCLERVILPSFTSSGRGGSMLYAFGQLLDVLDVATKTDCLFRLKSIDNFHSFTNYFLMERLWTPTVLESFVDKCGKISKRLQRRQTQTLTFGIHGGGNIGLGLMADLVTKPRRGLLRKALKEANINSEGSLSVNSNPILLTTSSTGRNISGDIALELLSMNATLSTPAASNIDMKSSSSSSSSESKVSSSSESELSSSEPGWRIIATTGRMFFRHLIKAGERIRLRHRVPADSSSTGNTSCHKYSYTEIPNVLLVDRSLSAVRELYVKSAIVALCVTLDVFQQIRREMAVGLLARFLHDEMPLTVLICINGTNTEQAVRDGVFDELVSITGEVFARRVLQGVNFVECVVDRIVRHVEDDDIAAQIIAQVTEKFGRADQSNASSSPDPTNQPNTSEQNGSHSHLVAPQQSGTDSGLGFTSQTTGDALFELCAATASKDRVKEMMNSPTKCPRLALLLVQYGIRISLFDAERVCSVYTRPFPESYLLPHFSLTDDLRVYEQVKNKFVNGPHYILSCLAGLSGYELIAHAIESSFIRSFVLELMEQEILPVLVRAFPTFAPPNGILDRLKREFILRCEENDQDTVARVARDPLRKMNRGRRIRGTLELRDKYKLSTPSHRLELGYCAALLHALQGKDNDSGEKFRQIFQSSGSYRAVLSYSGPTSSGPFVGYHPERESDRLQRLLAMIVVVKQLAIREKMVQIGLRLDLQTGHLFYQKNAAVQPSTPVITTPTLPIPRSLFNPNATHTTVPETINSSTPSTGGSLACAASNPTDGGQSDVLHQVQLQLRLQQQANVNATSPSSLHGQRSTSVSSNLDLLELNEQSDDRDDSADALLLTGNDSPRELSSTITIPAGAVSSPSSPLPIQLIHAPSRWLLKTITYEILFIRHGETYGNCGQSTRDGRIDRSAVDSSTKDKSRRIFQGDVDTEINQLTAHGQECAQHAAETVISEFVQKRKWQPEIVLHSPLKRAADTAKALISSMPALAPVTLVDEGLREMKFGLAENARICDLLESGEPLHGLSVLPDADAETHIWRRACHTFYQDQNASYRFPSGESFCDLLWRVRMWLVRLESRYPGKRLVVYGHSMWGAACAILFGRGQTTNANVNSVDLAQGQQTHGTPSMDEFLAFDGIHTMPHTTPIPINF